MKIDLLDYLDNLSKQYALLWELAKTVDEENEEEIFSDLKYMLYDVEDKYNAAKKKPLSVGADNDLGCENMSLYDTNNYSTDGEDCQA